MILKLNSFSAEDTFEIGRKLAGLLKGNELILLSGDLGAGKTVLTKGIGAFFKIEPNSIVSPTFTLMNIYEGIKKIFHLDLYRIGENLNGPVPEIDDNIGRGIIIVEWAQYLEQLYSREDNLINIELIAGDDYNESRDIIIGSEAINTDISYFTT
jgi:tRNA threonylcarbamoyladenosine biosynthesis protein TsaE